MSNTQLATTTHNIAVESQRATQEIQACITIAKQFKRVEEKCYSEVLKACSRLTLAEKAIYSYPRGGKQVTGGSIKLAKEMAKNWGNLEYGLKELESDSEKTFVLAYCWDMELNNRFKKYFTVKHERHTRQGVKKLTDPRDIYELVANMGSRRLRECIFDALPSELKEIARNKCEETMRKGGGNKPLSDRVREMIIWFESKGVTTEMIEKKLRHKISSIDETELVNLRLIANGISSGSAKRGDYFEIEDVDVTAKTKKLTDAILKKKPEEEKPAKKEEAKKEVKNKDF